MSWRTGAQILLRALPTATSASPGKCPVVSPTGTEAVRRLFQQALSALSGAPKKDKADRQLFDVKWHDEYATLGDDPAQTHQAMVAEDQRLRQSTLFTNPLRKTIFDEIVSHRQRFAVVRLLLISS